MSAATFAKETGVTLVARVAGLGLALLTSVVIARTLGPEGTGVYTLAILFPLLVITFTNLGIGPATVYYVAQGKYAARDVFGTNVVLSAVAGLIAAALGFVFLLLFGGLAFPTVSSSYLSLALLLVPVTMFGQLHINQILLGSRRIADFNAANVLYKLLLLVLVLAATVALGLGITGAIWANILASLLLCIVLFPWVKRIAGGISLRPRLDYVRDALTYGIKAHLGNIIGFLNYRVEVFLLGALAPATAVGFYAVAVGLAERLWFLSESASVVLFPTVSAEKDEFKKKTFTPLVSRSILLVTAVGAAILFLISHWVVVLLYSSQYLPAINLFRILLPGIVFLSADRILANDIAGRGLPLLNTYVGAVGIVVQVALNLLWIPGLGATGAAWATSISYGLTTAVRLWLYTRLSGNSLATVLLPQSADWHLYRQLAQLAWSRISG
ncbi:MAG TPA: flippase [Chloroflexi bacterium]|nr:flippase [Chloroflexota bacterium]